MPRHSISIAQSYPVFKFSRFSPETPCGLILYYILSVQETMFFCTGFLLCLCKYRIFVRDISHFPFFFCMIPYSFILLYSVVRLTPSSPAAVSRLPPVSTSARIMRSFSSFPSFSRKDGVVCKDGYSSSLSAPTVSPLREQHGRSYRLFQFPHVSCPCPCQEYLFRLLVETFRMPSQFLVGKLAEKLCQSQNVLPDTRAVEEFV